MQAVGARSRLVGQPPPLAGVPPPQRRYAPTPAEPARARAASSLTRGRTQTPVLTASWRYPPAAEPKKASDYFGVTWNLKRQKWCAQYQAMGTKRVAFSDDEEDAARAYDEMMRSLRPESSLVRSAGGRLLKFNFPTDEERAAVVVRDAPVLRDERPRPSRKRPHDGNVPWSSYNGVTWHKTKQKWQVRIQDRRIQGVKAATKSFGFFKSEVEAARAFDEAARRIYGESAHGWSSGVGRIQKRIILNFPSEVEQAQFNEENLRARRFESRTRRPSAGVPTTEKSELNGAPPTSQTTDGVGMLSSFGFGENTAVGEAAPLLAPCAAVPLDDTMTSRTGGLDESADGVAAGAQLHSFSPRYLDGELGHHQARQQRQEEHTIEQRQQQRQQLYLLRTALMIGGQELYAQVRQPQEMPVRDEGCRPIDGHHEELEIVEDPDTGSRSAWS